MYRAIIFLFTFLIFSTIEAQTTTEYAAMRASQVGEALPPERVYLHFDNTAYYLGETIWFKAFVTSHSEDSPTVLSRVLYVELMSPEGYVVKTEKYRIGDNGTCHGAIYMDPLYLSGFYEIRAYTRYMLNWGDGAIFSRTFPVFDKVNGNNWDFRNMRERDKGYFAGNTIKKEKEPELRFYPESGHLVDGITSRVAYELTGMKGMDAYEEITIFADKEPILATTPEHMGKGCFTITPKTGTEYTATVSIAIKEDGKKKKLKFYLPYIESNGFVLSVMEQNENFRFSIKSNSPNETNCAFAILHRSETGHYQKLNEKDSIIVVPKASMKEGVNRAIIFSGRNPVAERLFFVQHDTLVQGDRETVRLKVTGNGYMLHNLEAKPHEKINITIEREDGKPMDGNTDFAISVTDQAGKQTTSWGYNMYTYLLLGSEIKGYIPDAYQYFDTCNTRRKEHLDLVMLTNGWTAYNWKRLTASTLSGLVPPEEGINIRGQFVLRVKNRNRNVNKAFKIIPQRNNLVRLDYTFNNEKIIAETFRTDSIGRFCLTFKDFTGKQTAALSPSTIFRHSKNINYAFFIDKHFSPKPQPVHYWQQMLGSSIRHRKDTTGGMEKIGFNQYLLESVEIKADYNSGITRTAPISEMRLDYLDEWEYAMDVTYKEGIIERFKANEYIDSGPNIKRISNFGSDDTRNYHREIMSSSDVAGRVNNDRLDMVLSVNDVLLSIYKRYDLGWQNWVYPAVIKGEYCSDSIPAIDEKYLHGINLEAMTNFKSIIITSDRKKVETVSGSYGIWKRRESVLAAKHPYEKFYGGFLSQSGVTYHTGNESRIHDKDATEELSRLLQNIERIILHMEHPNQIAYLIPENRDNKTFIKNDLSVASSTRRYTTIHGYSPEKQFYSPDYSTMQPDSNDYRRTLLWSPCVKPVDGKLQVELYNSSTCNTLAVDVLGFRGNTIYSNSNGIATHESDTIGPTARTRSVTENDNRVDPALLAKQKKQYEMAGIYYKRKNYKMALTMYIELAQNGFPAALHKIGEFYLKGINLKRRTDLAAKFFESGAEHGNPECYYELARMYREGIHYAADREKEIEMLEIAAGLQEPKSILILSRYLLEGSFVEKDTARAQEMLHSEAIKGGADAMFLYALIMKEKNIERDSLLGTPLECINKAAYKGSHDAMLWKMRHEETMENYDEAYKMAKQMYINNNIEATIYLADCYLNGKGVGRDRRLAKDLYREAAAKGSEEAKRILDGW